MKNLLAVYRLLSKTPVTHMVRKYKTKKAFIEDLKSNGFTVIGVYDSEDFTKIKQMHHRDVVKIEHQYIREMVSPEEFLNVKG